MRHSVRPTTQFRKDVKRLKKHGLDMSLLKAVVKKLAAGEPLPEKNRDHMLFGDFAVCRACHITPYWLMIYAIYQKELLLYLTRTDPHSEI